MTTVNTEMNARGVYLISKLFTWAFIQGGVYLRLGVYFYGIFYYLFRWQHHSNPNPWLRIKANEQLKVKASYPK